MAPPRQRFVAFSGRGRQCPTTLRIGLPRIPISRIRRCRAPIVGRIVFSRLLRQAVCAHRRTSSTTCRSWRFLRPLARQEMTISCGPASKFQDGEPLDANLRILIERAHDMQASFPYIGLVRAVAHVLSGIRSPDHQLVLRRRIRRDCATLDRAAMVSPRREGRATKFVHHPVVPAPL